MITTLGLINLIMAIVYIVISILLAMGLASGNNTEGEKTAGEFGLALFAITCVVFLFNIFG